jgi:hypothetical protein
VKHWILPALALATLSSSAFARTAGEFGRELVNAQNQINSVLGRVGSGSPSGGNSGGSTIPSRPTPPSRPGNGGGWDFDADELALPKYRSAAMRLGSGGQKFLNAQYLEEAGQWQSAAVKRANACADVNIAMLDLALANDYAAQPGYSMELMPFNDDLRDLYNSIREGRSEICL